MIADTLTAAALVATLAALVATLASGEGIADRIARALLD